MGEQAKQGDGRNRVGASDDQAAAEGGPVSPTDDETAAAPVSGTSVRLGDRRGEGTARVRVGRAVWTIMNLLAVLVRLVTCVFAAILIIRIGLAFVAVNPHNVIVEWIVGAADVLVWGFRDLFLPTDPRIALVANDGLAAVFWVVVGVIAAWILTGLGRLAAGRSRS